MASDPGWLKEHIRDVHDFPKPGVVFKDITPLLADATAFGATVESLAGHFIEHHIDRVLGVEARGFIIAAPVADRLHAGFVPVRKGGKLPWEVESQPYDLEYGTDLLQIHRDGVVPGQRVIIIDDVLATGGTAEATIRLVEKLGAEVVGLGFVIELGFLRGRERLAGHDFVSLVEYE
jgi:adenine phosphoribosyltransferase